MKATDHQRARCLVGSSGSKGHTDSSLLKYARCHSGTNRKIFKSDKMELWKKGWKHWALQSVYGHGQCPFIFVFNNVEIMLIFMGLSPSATVRSATVSGCGPQGSNTGLLGLCTRHTRAHLKMKLWFKIQGTFILPICVYMQRVLIRYWPKCEKGFNWSNSWNIWFLLLLLFWHWKWCKTPFWY